MLLSHLKEHQCDTAHFLKRLVDILLNEELKKKNLSFIFRLFMCFYLGWEWWGTGAEEFMQAEREKHELPLNGTEE